MVSADILRDYKNTFISYKSKLNKADGGYENDKIPLFLQSVSPFSCYLEGLTSFSAL